jgi:four helix bundle protein
MVPDRHEELRQRTKAFALRVIRLSQSLPGTREGRVLGTQVLRCGTSVAANYRAAGRSRSKADFVSKISVVLEEADETLFWLEMLVEAGLVSPEKLQPLMREASELVRIFSASRTTAKS